MANTMMFFPETVEEFMEQYKIVDTEQIYTNGVELVPIFRMKQWFISHPCETPRWIPVENGLPEEEGQYLVSCNNDYEVEIGRFYIDDDEDDRWFCCDWSNSEDIVAWMPLPKPYKGGEEK